MKSKNKKPTEIYCVEDLFKYYLFGQGNLLYICNTISPKIVDLFSEIMNTELFVIYFDYREYDSDFARTHVKNGLVEYKLNKKFKIYKQTYKYPSKNKEKFMTTMLPDYIDKYCNYTREIKEQGLMCTKITYSSYGSKTEMVNEQFNLNISRQSIYLHEKELSPQYIYNKEQEILKEIEKLNIQPSGYYSYDEEFIKINKKIYVRLALIDVHTKMIINDELITKDQFNKEYIEKFLIESTKEIKLDTIITDGYRSYPEIIERLGAKHQLCTFHIMQNLMVKLNPYINTKQRLIESLTKANKKKEAKIEELKSKITLKRGRPKNSDKKVKNNINKRKKLKSEIDENKEKIRKYKAKIKEHVEYKETIKKIFRAKSFKTAMKYFNQLYDKLEELPPIIKNFIKTLSKKINKALEYTKDKKIPKTNNLVELLFKVTFPGKIKRIYRTYAGAVTQIKLDDLKWIEKNVLKKTGKNKIIS